MSTGQTVPVQPAGSIPAPGIPPLQQGDHLTQEEFHRRYAAMPHVRKAELIEGVVHIPSPINFAKQAKPKFNGIGWLGSYVALTPGTGGGLNGTLKLDLKNEPQPDAFLIIKPECGGRVKIDGEGYIVGGPELIHEVSASSVS